MEYFIYKILFMCNDFSVLFYLYATKFHTQPSHYTGKTPLEIGWFEEFSCSFSALYILKILFLISFLGGNYSYCSYILTILCRVTLLRHEKFASLGCSCVVNMCCPFHVLVQSNFRRYYFYFLPDQAQTHLDHFNVLDKHQCQISLNFDNG